LRETLRATETALNAMAQFEDKIQLTRSAAERQAFTRGRIQYYIETTVAATPEGGWILMRCESSSTRGWQSSARRDRIQPAPAARIALQWRDVNLANGTLIVRDGKT
jgi:hypothetical protein